jgi:hypothetical protein
MESLTIIKLVVFVPKTHAEAIRTVLAEAGAGKMGDYEACSFSVKGTGRFRPLKGSNPTIGTVGQLEEVDEERIETVCYEHDIETVLTAVRAAHPYEEPAIDVYPLLNHKY